MLIWCITTLQVCLSKKKSQTFVDVEYKKSISKGQVFPVDSAILYSRTVCGGKSQNEYKQEFPLSDEISLEIELVLAKLATPFACSFGMDITRHLRQSWQSLKMLYRTKYAAESFYGYAIQFACVDIVDENK